MLKMLNTNNSLSEEVNRYLSKDNVVVISYIGSKIKDLTRSLNRELKDIDLSRKLTVYMVDSILYRKSDELTQTITENKLSTNIKEQIKEIYLCIAEGKIDFVETDLTKIGFNRNDADQMIDFANIVKEQGFVGATICLNTCYDTIYPDLQYKQNIVKKNLKSVAFDINCLFK